MSEIHVIVTGPEEAYNTVGSWFEHHGATYSSRGGPYESCRGACKWIGRSNVNVQRALREGHGQQA